MEKYRKLLQINATLNWGSTGRIAESIGLLAKNEGWDSYIAHGARYVNPTKLCNIPVGGKIDNYEHAIKSFLTGAHGLGSRASTCKLVEKIKNLKPDIIHLHNIHGYYLNYQILFEYLSSVDIPVVWTLHDCWSMTGHCTHFDTIGCEKWKTGCSHCELKRMYYKSLFYDRSQSNYQKKRASFTSVRNLTIVPVSYWLERIVKDSFLNKYRTKVIHNGVDVDVFKPIMSDLKKQLNIDSNKKVILGVSSEWDDDKGLNVFCKLCEIPNLQVVLVGVTDVLKKKLPCKIITIPRTSNQQELAAYYSMADAFVNPTLCDSFPTVNLEALACGLPIITYRTGGSPEIIDQETGFVVEKGDYGGLLNAINTVFENGKGKYTHACRKRAVEKFNKNDRFMDYIKLYKDILNNRE